jgi:hypothetical protein
MKVSIWLAIALAGGCDVDDDHLHILAGGGGQQTATGPGTIGVAPTTVLLIAGRACLLADPRFFAVCADTGAAGLTVALAGRTVTTGTNGSFAMSPPQGTANLVFTVSGPNIITSTQPFAAVNTIPVLTQQMFNNVLTANGITLTQGSGSILASVVTRGGFPAVGVTAVSTPSPAFGPFFDGTTPTAFTLNGTGARGVVFFPGVSVGPASLTFTDLATSGETTVDGVQVVDGGLTLVDAVLP